MHVCMCTCIFAGWGRIVNTASGHGLVASANKSAYIASKHGIVGLTKVSHDYLSFVCTYKQSGREKSSLNSIYMKSLQSQCRYVLLGLPVEFYCVYGACNHDLLPCISFDRLLP